LPVPEKSEERVSDILAADPALYRLNGRYLRAPGLISRALAMTIERAPRSQFWAINLATEVGAFVLRRLNSLDEMGSGTIVVDRRCAYFE
jgi:hypothetical protein